jgi:hypothetical protein
MATERQRLAMILGRAPRVRLVTYEGTSPQASIHRAVARGEFVFLRVSPNDPLIARIERDHAARVSQATARGKEVGGNVVATCSVVSGGIDEIVDELMRWKYGWSIRFDGPGSGRQRKKIVQLSLKPDVAEHDDSPALRD